MADIHDYRPLYPGMGQAVAERTYLRKKDNGEWETWGEVAHRVALGNSLLCKNKNEQKKEYEILRHHLANASLLLSGRHLQHGDENQPNRGMEIYTNCSTSASSFMLFYLLLNGSGVGRCYDDDMMLVNWDYAPAVRCVISHEHADFDWSAHESLRDAKHKYGTGKDVMWYEVPDSREGWAKALELWENAAFQKVHADKMLILDFSKVRPKGSPIAGMQHRPSSGPVPLMNAFHKAATLKGAGLERWRQALYLDHYFAECVLVGGARRSARMSTKTWKDESVLDFITVKRPIEYDGLKMEEIIEMREDNSPDGFLWSSNNSVTVDEEFWKLVNLKRNERGFSSDLAQHARRVLRSLSQASYADGTGEPGIINVDKLVQKEEGWEKLTQGDYIGSEKYQIDEETELYLSRLARKAKRKKYLMITNPCLTSDTPVYVADGRTSVTIGQLAEEGKDVPVFCLDDDGEVVIRVMRNPRITGYDNKILKITLDNGQSLRVTENHKFLLRGKDEYRRADELQPGDSLFVINRYEPDFSSESRGDQYVGIGYSGKLDWEHRLVAQYRYDMDIIDGNHVHHLNEDKTDNRPENLKIRIGTEHLSEHSVENENANYSGFTNEELLRIAIDETKRLGRRVGHKEWQKFAKDNGYPQTFSKWRENHFNGISGFLKQAAMKAGLDPMLSRIDIDPRVIRSYMKMIEQGYDADIVDGGVILNKKCECCGTPMEVNFLTPEVGLCSQSCKNKMRENNDTSHMQSEDVQKKALSNRKKILEERKAKTREEQLVVYNNVKFHIRRNPTRAEFQDGCRSAGISPEVGRKTSPWTSWRDLQNAAGDRNHKVVSVEVDGYENVYNGTVDEFHNFFVGGFEETTRSGKSKLVWVNNTQCGEIALTVLGGYCTIADVVPFHADTLDEAEEAFRAAARALIRVNTMDCLYKAEVERTNRIGVGMTGVMEFAWKFFGYSFRDLIDEEKSKDFWLTLARFNRAIYEEAVSYSKKIGVTIPHTMTTIKPAGTTSKLFGLCEGWHLPSMKWYVRWVQFRDDDPLIAKYRASGYPVRELRQYRGHVIVGFPTQPVLSSIMPPELLVSAAEATPEEQYKWLMLGEKYYIHGTDEEGNPAEYNVGNQISYTLKYSPDEVDFKNFKEMLVKYQSQIRCCSVMPQEDAAAYEYQPEEPVTKAKYEEISHAIKAALEEDIGREHVDCENNACPIDFNSDMQKEVQAA